MTAKNQIGTRDLLEQVILRAVVETLEAIKKEHRGNENLVMREIKGLHRNVTKNDLPEYLKKEIAELVTSSLGFMNGHDFQLTPKK